MSKSQNPNWIVWLGLAVLLPAIWLTYQLPSSDLGRDGQTRETASRRQVYPDHWLVIDRPPDEYSLIAKRSRKTLPGNELTQQSQTDILYTESIPETVGMAVIKESDRPGAREKALVNLVLKQPPPGSGPYDLEDPKLLDFAKALLAGEKYSKKFYLWLKDSQSLFVSAPAKEEIGKKTWKVIAGTVRTDATGKPSLAGEVLWTTVGTNALFVMSRTFEAYRKEILQEVRQFLSSYQDSRDFAAWATAGGRPG